MVHLPCVLIPSSQLASVWFFFSTCVMQLISPNKISLKKFTQRTPNFQIQWNLSGSVSRMPLRVWIILFCKLTILYHLLLWCQTLLFPLLGLFFLCLSPNIPPSVSSFNPWPTASHLPLPIFLGDLIYSHSCYMLRTNLNKNIQPVFCPSIRLIYSTRCFNSRTRTWNIMCPRLNPSLLRKI